MAGDVLADAAKVVVFAAASEDVAVASVAAPVFTSGIGFVEEADAPSSATRGGNNASNVFVSLLSCKLR